MSGLFSVVERGDPHVLTEVLGKRALVAETEIQGNVADRFVSAAQLDAGGLDSRFDKKRSGVGAEYFAEPAIELANRHSGSPGQVCHVDGLLKVVANVTHCSIQLHMRRQGRAPPGVALHRSHYADDALILAKDRELIREIPVRQPLPVEEQFHDFEHRFSSFHDSFIIVTKFAGQLVGEQFEVVFTDQIGFRFAPKPLPECPVSGDNFEVAILGKERYPGQMIKEDLKMRVGGEFLEELFLKPNNRTSHGCFEIRVWPDWLKMK